MTGVTRKRAFEIARDYLLNHPIENCVSVEQVLSIDELVWSEPCIYGYNLDDYWLAYAKRSGKKWFLYILQCKDGSFYTGVTKDLQRRLKMHKDGKASHYTRSRRPVKLLYQESDASRAQVLVRECAVKAFSRKKKEELIAKLP